MAIYTYIDQDYFIPMEDTRNQNRRHIPYTSTHITAGIKSLPIHCLHTSETLPRSTAGKIHERLSREDSVEFMSIMAAVDWEDMKM